MRLAAAVVLLALPGLAATSVIKGKASGDAGAPIQIELYSDFQCPSCKALHEQTLPALKKDFVATGKVHLIYREFPLAMHAHAREAACYAAAAARVGKYEQVADVLFQDQTAWANSGKVEKTACRILSPEDAKAVRLLAKDPSVVSEVERELQSGVAAGISGTPTMLITYRAKQYPINRALNYDLLRRFLDDLLTR